MSDDANRIIAESEARASREAVLGRHFESYALQTSTLVSLMRNSVYDAHVISWLVLNYWHVEVGRNGEWRLA